MASLHQPDGKPEHPPGTRSRWDNTPRTSPDQPRSNAYPPRTANPERWARERPDDGSGYTRSEPSNSALVGRTSSPPPERAYSPPSSRSESSTSSRVESSNSGIQQATSTDKEK